MNRLNIRLPAWSVYFLSVTGGFFTLFILVLILVWMGVFGYMPGTQELRNIQQQQASQILTSDGQFIGTYPVQEGVQLTMDEISPELIDALLAIEDIRFYRHNGIDYRALGRVLIRTILLRQNSGGGSTLTQQLAKNLYPRSHRRGIYLITDKLREMIIATRIESVYTKDEILTIYLNRVSFGENTIGIDGASRRFFNKPASDLTLSESATLAGQLKATTYYNPYRNPDRSERRRNIVIRQMERYGKISADTADVVVADSLSTDYNRFASRDETALHFRNQLRGKLIDILQNIPALDGKQYQLETDELTIYTTLDSRVQAAAESAVQTQMRQLQEIFDREYRDRSIFAEVSDPDVLRAWRQSGYYRELVREGISEDELFEILHTPVPTPLFTWDGYQMREVSPYDELRYYLSFLNAGMLAIHPNTGHILAWVGGINHRHFPFDQILARRQSGSAFKPVVYAAALEEGRLPCDYVQNRLTTFAAYDNWTPRNHEEEYGGYYSLQAALARSVNTATVQLGMDVGIPAIRRTASAMGIRSIIPDDSPSIVLGTAETTLLELTTAYTTFLNQGQPVSPVMITRILNSDGDIIYDFTSDGISLIHLPSTRNVDSDHISVGVQHVTGGSDTQHHGLAPETAAAMISMLEKSVNEGTGYPLRSRFGITHALGGKTGTTQQYADGWFVGFTPEMVFGVRVGGWNQRVHFREFPAFGSQTALPVAGYFLNHLSADGHTSSLPDRFPSQQIDSPFNLSCSDYRDDRFRDRLRNFFTGQSSDDPVVVEEDEETGRSRNVFRRLGRRLGISDN